SATAIGGLSWWYGADLPNSDQIAATLAGSTANIPGFTPLGELPPEVIKAFLAAEDEDFYAHGGYSRTAILRAIWRTMSDKRQGGRRHDHRFCGALSLGGTAHDAGSIT